MFHSDFKELFFYGFDKQLMTFIYYLSFLICGRLLIREVQCFDLTQVLLVPADEIQREC